MSLSALFHSITMYFICLGYKITTPTKKVSTGNQLSDKSSAVESLHVEGNKTPIQRVLVKQITAAEVLKTPKENDIVIECIVSWFPFNCSISRLFLICFFVF